MRKLNFKSILTRLAVLLIVGQTFLTPISAFADVLNQSEVTEKVKNPEVLEPIKDNGAGIIEAEISPLDKVQGEEVSINENARSKASPTTDQTEAVQKPVKNQEQVNNDELGSLSVGQDGKIYYKGEPLYVGSNGEEIPADLNELMKQGVPQTLTIRSSRAAVGIQYNGQVSYGGTTVGDFSVNGKQSFCLQHPKPTPATGTQGDMSPYDNLNVQRILYYGWEGPQNIFGSDRARGIVVTSLVLSKYYNGDVSGMSILGWAELDNLAQNGSVPDDSIQINNLNSLVNLKVNLNGGKQVSETAILNADKANSITVEIPSGIKFINETTGLSTTNSVVKINGGEKFHLEADAKTTYNYNSGVKGGTVKAFQPLVIRPFDSNLQDIGTWQWYDDPKQVVSFKADFFARLGDVHLVKEDSEKVIAQGDATLEGAIYRIKDSVGTSRDVTITNGKATAKDLLIGEITYQEIKAPVGYLLDPTVYRATLDYNSQTGKIELTRTVKEEVIKGNIDIMKYFSVVEGSSILLPEKSAGFSVYLESNGTLVQTKETNALGHVSFTGLPYGTYLVKQTKAPAGTLPVADFEVKVDEHGKTYFYTILNGKFKSPTQLIKVDAETGENILVPGTIFKIKDLGTGLWVTQTTHKITEFETDENGQVLLFDELRFGDYELYEIKAPTGYVLDKTPHKFSVNQESQDNGMIVVKYENNAQKGKVIVHKTGDVATGSKTTNTNFGKKYEFVYSQKGLAGAEFDAIAAKDIVTGDGTIRTKKGEVAGTGVTDDKGHLMISDLYLGEYELVETKAPAGMVLDANKYAFELTYAGQEIAVTSTEVDVKNNLQELLIKVYKSEEAVKWVDGTLVSEDVPSNDKVFGIYTNQDYVYNKKVIVPNKALVGTATTKAGIAEIQQKYPEGKFFIKELDAGTDHMINPTEFEFEFTAQDNNKTLEIGVWADSVAYGKQNLLKIARNSITNELARAAVELVKTDALDGKALEGVGFDLIHTDKEAVETVIGSYETDKEGKISVENLPTGNYKFVETKPLNWYEASKKDLSFVVSPENDGEVIKLTAVNKRKPLEITTLFATTKDGHKQINPAIDNDLTDTGEIKGLKKDHKYYGDTFYMNSKNEVVSQSEMVITGDGTEAQGFKTALFLPKNTLKDGEILAAKHVLYSDKEKTKEVGRHNEDLKDKKQMVEAKTPKVGIQTQAHTGDGKTQTFTHGDIINAYDNVKATHTDVLDGTKRALQPILVAVIPENGKTIERDIWTSEKIDYIVNDEVFAKTVVTKVDTSQYPEGTTFYFKEIGYNEAGEKDTEHNLDGKDRNQSLTPIKKPLPLPQTGEDETTFILMGVLLVGMVLVGFVVRNNRQKKEKQTLLENVQLYGYGGKESIFTENDNQAECEAATKEVQSIIETNSKIDFMDEGKVCRLLEKIGYFERQTKTEPLNT
ncbi:SpaA isopeptide-forming pilin-related protein [Carnobacterium maltaromaticum]|uniref:SpaA isopeptide-forming pilin-related protein n=1 Tax=Carnobacterium maltaromaticum TaxID=2751 RepID=UPI0012F9576B|nr:SpaA isopeptide-forming pilin-related protein [Carnobacterium maltaromaticum]